MKSKKVIASMKWQKENPDKAKKYNQRWRDKNKEKRRIERRNKYRKDKSVKPRNYRIDEDGNKIIRIRIRTKEKGKYTTRFAILKRDDFTCQYCGRKAPFVVLEVDHIYPKSKGGRWKLENLITSCFECNRGKRDNIL